MNRKDYQAAYYQSNREKLDARSDAWRKANPEKVRARKAKWNKSNFEEVKVRRSAWNNANPEALRIYGHNKRAGQRENGGKLSKGLPEKLLTLQRGKCACCKIKLDKYHLDHMMPLALGGANSDENIQLLCPPCNMQKHTKHPIDFMQQRGFLI
jgi:5-methylcytosine-specific restriction endonuclease McrA